jgi:hypothetical protein
MGQVGQLSAEMVLDDKSFTVTAQKLDGMITLLRTDLSTLGESVRNVTDALGQSSQRMSTHNKTMSEGEAALRGFYREQRLQDRTIRESSTALLGFTVGMSALIGGTEGGSEGVKKFEKVVLTTITAMQAAEFTAAGMGIAGKNLGGTLGNVAGFLEKNAGWIGVIVGLSAGFISMFQKTNTESKKAAEEGLKQYNEMLDKISGKMQDFTDTGVVTRKAGVQRELEIVEARIAIINRLRKAESDGENFYATDQEFEKAALTRKEAIDISKKALDALYRRSQELAIELNSIPNVITAKNPNIVKKDEKEKVAPLPKSETDKGYVDAIAGLAEYGKKRYEVSQITKEEYLEQLNIARKLAGESTVGLDIQKTIDDLMKQQIEDAKKQADEEKRAREHATETAIAEYELGEKTRSQVVAELRAQMALTGDAIEQLKIKEKIRKLEDEELDQYARIAQLLNQAFTKDPDSFIAKLSQALQIAVQIAKYLKSADDSKTTSLDSFESGIGIIGSIISLFGLKMGSTSSAPSSTPAVISQNYRRPSSQGMDINWASAIQARAERTISSMSQSARVIGSDGGDSTSLVREMRAMRTELAAKDFSIHLHNPITLGEGLKKEMPVYNKFAQRKIIGDINK